MKFRLVCILAMTFLILNPVSSFGEPSADSGKQKVLLDDAFERVEADPEREEIGNGWQTNSQRRAKGAKQVWLDQGAMRIRRAPEADHAVSVTHEAAFRNATISLRFKLGPKDDLGINIADMKEKSVHAGHICVARIRQKRLEITDLKTGRMDLATRKRRLAGKATDADQQRIKAKQKYFPIKLDADEWHTLEVRVLDDLMTVVLDGKEAGRFRSEGISHPTKSRLRLSVGRSAWVDDVKIIRH